MKRLLTIVLFLILLGGTAIAESVPIREFTVDEQAYDVYLDVSYVHNQSVRYLTELTRLWDLANDLDDISEADKQWFHAGLVANFGNSDSDIVFRFARFQALAEDKYGFSQIPDLYPIFKTLLSAYSEKTTDIIWAGLALGIDAKFIVSPDALKSYMDNAMQGIRSIMSTDREYPFLKDLQNYYKEASYLLDYISDFKDNYIGCQEMLDTQTKNQSSYTIDFEFIFNPDDFDYVREVRSAEAEEKAKAIYNRAFALENSGDYAGAIDLYWQCTIYEDASDRVIACNNAIKEQQYQKAIAKENEGDYQCAALLFSELDDYKDSAANADRLINAEKETVYQKAIEAANSGNKEEAIALFNSIKEYKDAAGRVLALTKKYSRVSSFHDGIAVVTDTDGQRHYINTNGVHIPLDFKYDSLHSFSEGYAAFSRRVKIREGEYDFYSTYVDTNGNIVIPEQKASGYGFYDGFALMRTKVGKYDYEYYYIDKQGNQTAWGTFINAYSFKNGLALAKDKNKEWFVLTASSGAKVPLNEYFPNFPKHLTPEPELLIYGVYVDSQGSFIDTTGNQIRAFDNAVYFSEGYAKVLKKDKWGFVDPQINLVIPCEWKNVGFFSDGMAAVYDGSKWGFINRTGKLVIPCKWDYVEDFHEGLAWVFRGTLSSYGLPENGKWGCLNKDGHLVVPFEWDEVADFSEGFACALKNNNLTIFAAEDILKPNVLPLATESNPSLTSSTGNNPINVKSNQYTTLKPGSKGQAVLDARMKLYELGYFNKKPTQKEYTNNMKDYVKKFEKDNGLKQDGILSPEDQEVLFGL